MFSNLDVIYSGPRGGSGLSQIECLAVIFDISVVTTGFIDITSRLLLIVMNDLTDPSVGRPTQSLFKINHANLGTSNHFISKHASDSQAGIEARYTAYQHVA